MKVVYVCKNNQHNTPVGVFKNKYSAIKWLFNNTVDKDFQKYYKNSPIEWYKSLRFNPYNQFSYSFKEFNLI